MPLTWRSMDSHKSRQRSKSSAKLGVTMAELSPEELKAFQDATKPVYEKWKARIGAELVEAAEKAVANRGK